MGKDEYFEEDEQGNATAQMVSKRELDNVHSGHAEVMAELKRELEQVKGQLEAQTKDKAQPP